MSSPGLGECVTTKPYAKLEDCVGKKLESSRVYDYSTILVFEDAWSRLELYGYDGDEGAVSVMRERGTNPTCDGMTFVELGLVTPEEHARAKAEKEAHYAEVTERENRKLYEKLRAKYEVGGT